MSGGSFDYLCSDLQPWAGLGAVANRRQSMLDMAEDMAGEGCSAAAVPLLQLAQRISVFEAWVEAALAGGHLADLAKAWEWYRSSDWGIEQFEAEWAKYVESRP